MEQSERLVKFVLIAHSCGLPLVSVKIDPNLDENLIAPFISALKSFSEHSIGAMDTSRIKAGNLDLLFLSKHDLNIIAIMDINLKKIQVEKEAEEALDLIYQMYEKEIKLLSENKACDMDIFSDFEKLLKKQIESYYEKIKDNGNYDDNKDSFFGRLIKLFKKQK